MRFPQDLYLHLIKIFERTTYIYLQASPKSTRYTLLAVAALGPNNKFWDLISLWQYPLVCTYSRESNSSKQILNAVTRGRGFSPPSKCLSRSVPSLSMTMNLSLISSYTKDPKPWQIGTRTEPTSSGFVFQPILNKNI